jgi:hypothetical protein
MSRLTPKHVLAAGCLVAATAAATSGCADNDSSLFVQAVVRLEAPQCTAKADPNATLLGGGVLDRAFPGGTYDAALLVGNQLTRLGSRTQHRTETSRIVIRGAIVNVMDDKGEPLQEFTVDATGFVDPGSGDDPGYGIVFAPIVPPGVGEDDTSVTAHVKVFGETLGGTEVESAELSFPVFICRGCLVTVPAEACDPATGVCSCLGGDSSGVEAPCRMGQDDPVDCRLCAATAPDVCRI